MTAMEMATAAEYADFLASKALTLPAAGRDIAEDDLHPALKDFQRAGVRWALLKGRAALLFSTGLGKTIAQLAWARHAAERVLIVAPLAVAQQTVREGARWDIPVTYARRQVDAASIGITITNYEMVEHFDAAAFGAVVLDEASILKSHDGKTRTALIRQFAQTPMRLCCTATPAPNDIAEIANYAEFLGVMSRVEMLATFFVHDEKEWRLKGHARDAFYRWLASWGLALRYPSDLGFDDTGYRLPPLHVEPIICQSSFTPEGQLFATGLHGISDHLRVRANTITDRVKATVDLIRAEPDEPWIVWCGLNAESDAIAAALPEAVVVEGSQSPDEKARRLLDFVDGRSRILVTKASVAGFGLNLQHCARMVFLGLSYSWEQYFQAIRRCYRFGQTRDVRVWVVLSDLEESIWSTVLQKEAEADKMTTELIKHVAEFERAEISTTTRQSDIYAEDEASGKGWRALLGDSCVRLAEVPDNSIDLSVFSPPFASLFTYSNSDRDLGNSRNYRQFWRHFRFIIAELLRVTKPGRNVCVHVSDITTTKATDGVIGLRDLSGDTIRAFQRAGFTYYGRTTTWKSPQSQAIRTKAKALLFVQLERDSAASRPALADYLLVFQKPGVNAVPIRPDVSRDEWIEWASPIWTGIRENHTLNAAEARESDDERHVAPLQLDFIERCIRLWSNRGERVLSPFLGIGSEGYMAVKLGREFIGIELKASYFQTAVRNLRRAEAEAHTPDLFTWAATAEQQPELAS